jgi:acylphosphatase
MPLWRWSRSTRRSSSGRPTEHTHVVRRRAVVRGRVQGVFFRDTCRKVAREHDVAGSAANLPDGSVEVILEGESPNVEEVLEWCRSGPSYADVSSVEVSEEEPEGLEGFRIA